MPCLTLLRAGVLCFWAPWWAGCAPPEAARPAGHGARGSCREHQVSRRLVSSQAGTGPSESRAGSRGNPWQQLLLPCCAQGAQEWQECGQAPGKGVTSLSRVWDCSRTTQGECCADYFGMAAPACLDSCLGALRSSWEQDPSSEHSSPGWAWHVEQGM